MRAPGRTATTQGPSRLAAWLAAALLTVACGPLPRDQRGASAEARANGRLVVGVPAERAPADSLVAARERALVEEVARRLGVRIAWRTGDTHELLGRLQEWELPIVAAAVTSDTPFGAHVALSKPFWKDGPGHRDYVLAVAPGENALLLLVDQVVAEADARRAAGAGSAGSAR
jgi:ABC-type amino acid transport substrate-binding protein